MKGKRFSILWGIIFSTFVLFLSVTAASSDNILSDVTDVGGPTPGLDLVFIPVGFDDMNEFDSLVMEHIDPDGIYKGILYYEPFKGNWSKFNFLKTERLPAEIENNFIQRHCQYGDSDYIWRCIQDVKDWLSENNCLYDKAIIIYNNLPPNTGGGWAESLNGTIALTLARVYPPFESQGNTETVHELAHLLGLTDEAVKAYEFEGYGYTLEEVPNCDFTGCQKWCQDYVRNPSGEIYDLCKNLSKSDCEENVNCFWRNTVDEFYKTQCVPLDDWINIGLNCLEGTGCYYNCNGVGAWRPANYTSEGQPTSMMFYMFNALGFDSVDKRHLELVLSEYTAEAVSAPSIPGGAAIGKTGVPYSYATGGSISNFDHPVEYQFDWKGDETDLSAWGPATQDHIWSDGGTYYIRARARCATHTNVVSAWSGSLSVTILQISLQSPVHEEVFRSCSLINNYQPTFRWSPTGTYTGFKILFSASPTDFTTRGIKVAAGSVRGASNTWKPSSWNWKTIMKASDNSGSIRSIYWKVVGTKSDRTTIESDVRSFSIEGREAQVVTINAPPDDSILDRATPPTFDFDTNCNTKFRLEISSLSNFSVSTKIKRVNFTTSNPNLVLSMQKRLPFYQWTAVKKMVGTGTGYFRIKAWDGIGRETVSEIRTFTIQ